MGAHITGPFDVAAAQDIDPLRRHILQQNQYISELYDPAYGRFGQELLQAFETTGCIEAYAPSTLDGADAAFIPFDSLKPVPLNRISYEFFTPRLDSRVHEWVHPIQMYNAPAYHASPFNANCGVLPTPEDWMTLNIYVEAVAYAYEHWAMYFSKSAVPPDAACRYTSFYNPAVSVEENLRNCAAQTMANNRKKGGRMVDYYADQALKWYEDQVPRALKADPSIQFVRFENSDLKRLGAVIGPNIYADGWCGLPQPNDTHRQKAYDLYATLAIPPRSTLPTFTEALMQRGLTPDSYLTASRMGLPHCGTTPHGVLIAA